MSSTQEHQDLETKASKLIHCDSRETLVSSIHDLFTKLSLRDVPLEDFSPKEKEKIQNSLNNIQNSKRFPHVKFSLKKLITILMEQREAMKSTFSTYCFAAFQAMDNIVDNILKLTVKKHFELKKVVRAEEISFSTKSSGDQIGFIVKVEDVSGRASKFYCKTHHRGARRLNSIQGSEPVDVAELLVYLVLNQLDSGPWVEFCCKDEHDFFILSRDASEELDNSHEGNFREYSFFKHKMNNQKLLDCNIDSLDQQDYAYIKFLCQADLISRILNLSDVINNPGNWGIVFSKDAPMKLQILDFLLSKDRESPWQDFKEGNGIYNYWTCRDPIVRTLIFEKEFHSRFDVCKPIFEWIKERWDPSKAFQEVRQFLNDQGLENSVDMERGELYLHRIRKNFGIFEEGFSHVLK
eukprot:gb/GECH01014494.1/.p1 GENE.gb/GECH01014494.1/~~gb/GECH01014494.1/.p1  ORF type:complete len:409 (+),score=53.12 gb/GECH01014494.1/:1-1227(+)